MKIADIKDQALRELAIKRYLEQCDIEDITWQQTPEGNQFWVKVNLGTITELPKDTEAHPKDIQEQIIESNNKIKILAKMGISAVLSGNSVLVTSLTDEILKELDMLKLLLKNKNNL